MESMEESGFDEIEGNSLTQHRRAHWDKVYTSKDYTQVLWHQSSPEFSLRLIEALGVGQEDEIIDVGCGASLLADCLIKKAYKNMTLLDASIASLEIVKERLGSMANQAEFICSDVTQFRSKKKFDLWHDRAVFHFLLHESERKHYFETMHETLKKGGIAILSTFSLGGPTQCSGLDIIQYDEHKMKNELVSGLELLKSKEAIHQTPKETFQNYRYFIIQKS